uniref:Uncharacterized protein n=1 Tax=Globodera pallida TaxID=36090 RepID=A0A183BVK4_GLOPA
MPTTGPGQSGQPPKKRVRFRNDGFFVQVHIYDPNPMKWAAFDEQSQPLRQKISGGNNIRAEERKREKYPKKEETDGWRLMSVDDAIQRFEPGQNSVARAIETERCANIVEECWEDRMSVTEVEPLDEENGTTGADELFCETKIIPLG